MALTKATFGVTNISDLSSTPNATEGLTAAQLQAKFDKTGADAKTYINDTLTAEIDAENVILTNATSCLSATAVTNGDYKINITNPLTSGMILYISFPAASTNTQNARLSIDNGSNYKNILNVGTYQCLGSDVELRCVSLVYNGTSFIAQNISDVGKSLNIGKTATQSVDATTLTKITYAQVISNETKGLSFNDTDDSIVIGKGIKSITIHAQYQENTLTAGIQKYIYIYKNNSLVQSYQINNQNITDIRGTFAVTENDYFQIYCYGSLALTVQNATAWTFFKMTVLG